MEFPASPFVFEPIVAALIALKPMSYVVRLGIAVAAFAAATNVESVFGRVFALAWMIVVGGGLLIVGVMHGTVVDILLGLLALGAAVYAWWFTRV